LIAEKCQWSKFLFINNFRFIIYLKAENRKILNEQCAEKMLIYLLLSDNDETKSAAAHALSVMAESTFCQDAIRNYG
jgi:hypothetical protein